MAHVELAKAEAVLESVRDAWLKWRSGYDSNELAIKRMLATSKSSPDIEGLLRTYDDSLRKAVNNTTLALELLRQMCVCSRTVLNDEHLLEPHLPAHRPGSPAVSTGSGARPERSMECTSARKCAGSVP